MEVHSSIEGNQGADFGSDLETQPTENSCEESVKRRDYNTAMVVYGLPHIVLSN